MKTLHLIEGAIPDEVRAALATRPWRLEVTELMAYHRANFPPVLLDGYVRVHPKPSGDSYTYAWVYYRKPLGYLMVGVQRLKLAYYATLATLALWGFLKTDLDGGVLRLRDFTLNILRVHRDRLDAAYKKKNEAHGAGFRWGYQQGRNDCYTEFIAGILATPPRIPDRRPNAWPWEMPVPNGVIADLKDPSLEGKDS